MGCVYHGSCALLGSSIKEILDPTHLTSIYNKLFIPVALLFILGIVYVSLYLGFTILKGRSNFKKIVACFVPFNISVLIYLIDYLSDFNMAWITVSAFNISILLFLISCIVFRRKH